MGSLEEVFLKVGEEDEIDGSLAYDQDNEDDKINSFENKMINDYRFKRGYFGVMISQVCEGLLQRFTLYSRSSRETLFEILVPVIMIFIGLSLSFVDFKEETPIRHMTPENYLWKQSIFINEALVKFGEEPSALNQTDSSAEDGDFDDESEWPSNLPVDLHPSVFAESLPRSAEAFNISYYDLIPDTLETWEN